jgi:hypothetical protein
LNFERCTPTILIEQKAKKPKLETRGDVDVRVCRLRIAHFDEAKK